ncbi:MAG: tRNA (pseudouridine(54)-N(1))-methyltransferase TrmY [Candidatus Methanoperedens sp.]|nr:tRNA (pseudouridine(54)-N(1))-methyltransferase TrmY [Candidatus Methanoperedens sp.]MCZ7371767.1 tRNA (pseudouridine(54)-N(1))-methyltransferase TrmY [Candidatus Methanoperedens sp.]
MREFILYSRTGSTGPRFKSLIEAGRLDVVYQCILMSLFMSHSIRRDVIFHAILGGPPSPPLELVVDGRDLRDARLDERTWEDILRNILSGRSHPGVHVQKKSLQQLVKEKSNIFVLEESGESIRTIDLGTDPVFVLGDQVGLPRKDEEFVLRYGKKVSIGQKAYLASACVGIINYILDQREIRVPP